jgi:hypothetical protein
MYGKNEARRLTKKYNNEKEINLAGYNAMR